MRRWRTPRNANHGVQTVNALLLSRPPGHSPSLAVCAQHAGAVRAAFDRLWAAGVHHGDIAARNLLISSAGDVTIIDFGLATVLADAPAAAHGPRLGGDRECLVRLLAPSGSYSDSERW